jgi:hypothetical protein
MKISAEVREFARLNPPMPSSENPDRGLTGIEASGEIDADMGMARMSEKYREGGDLYVPSAD